MEIKWDFIERIMKSKNISNGKMTEILGIGATTWGRYKNNSTDIPFKLLYKIIEILNIQFNDVIIDSEVIEYRKYLKEARYDPDELNIRIQKNR